MKSLIKKVLHDRLSTEAYEHVRVLGKPSEAIAMAKFIILGGSGLSLVDRATIIRRMVKATARVPSPHWYREMLEVMGEMLRLPQTTEGVFVEAGCFKGSSTAKLSIAARIAGRPLVVFDSFRGMPDHDEEHITNIFGGEARFDPGSYCGTLEEVQTNVNTYGELNGCSFVEGWFEDTLPAFDVPVCVAYIDVDLVSSTKTCLRYLFPKLVPGGLLFSQDGHLPLVIDLLRDERFWREEVGVEPPIVEGLGTRRLVSIRKRTPQASLAAPS